MGKVGIKPVQQARAIHSTNASMKSPKLWNVKKEVVQWTQQVQLQVSMKFFNGAKIP